MTVSDAAILWATLALTFFMGWFLIAVFWIRAEMRWRKYQQLYFRTLKCLPVEAPARREFLTEAMMHLAQRPQSRWG